MKIARLYLSLGREKIQGIQNEFLKKNILIPGKSRILIPA